MERTPPRSPSSSPSRSPSRALVLPACADAVAPAEVESVAASALPAVVSSAPSTTTPVALDLEAPASCDGSGPRWIAADGFTGTCADPASSCACPSAPGWIASRAFAVVPEGSTKPAPIPPLLSPYCLYEWAGAEFVDGLAIGALHQAIDTKVEGLTEDCVVVAPHAHPVNDLVRPWLRAQLREAEGGAGRCRSAPSPRPPSRSPSSTPRRRTPRVASRVVGSSMATSSAGSTAISPAMRPRPPERRCASA